MISKRSVAVQLALLAAAVTTHAAPAPKSNDEISWYPCNESTLPKPMLEALQKPIEALGIKCGSLPVPLDYTSPKPEATIDLELLSVPAAQQPAKGTILFNFGGPGNTARGVLAASAPTLLALTGGQYNLLAFDPRGTGNTIPINCFENEIDMFEFVKGSSTAGYSSDTALGQNWARADVNANACLKNANDTVPYISSAFVARDLMSVVDALDEDGLLRYWGISYGTALGATAAAMFPDRIDKMVLDGVLNIHQYYHTIADFEEWTFSDRVFSEVFNTCLENSDHCALAHRHNDPRDLENTVWKLIESLKYRPLSFDGFTLDHSGLKNIIAGALYNTASWEDLAVSLELLLSGMAHTAPERFGGDAMTLVAASPTLMALHSIRCVDKDHRSDSFEEYVAANEKLHNISRFYGDLTSALAANCARWKLEPKERYEGDFNVKTKNPVLFVNNKYDAHTPVISAYNASSTFEGSVVLEINGYGHGSLNLPSACTLKKMAAYWTGGKLPGHGTVCEIDAQPFSNRTWNDVFEDVSF